MGKKITEEKFVQKFNQYTNDTVILLSKYVNRKTKIRVKCKTCGYEWDISPYGILYQEYHFQGCPECKYQECECDYCHKKIKRLKSKIKSQNFCSIECGNKYKNELKTNLINGFAYRRNAFNVYPHQCAICGWNKDERVLEVHHIDENRQNNDINNLIILCPICHKFLTLHLYSLDELQRGVVQSS